MAAIVTRDLQKRYGAVRALDGLDLEIEAGEVFGVLGPNGAGKTTLVEILEGYRRRSGGDATVLGVDPERGGREWRARLGIVPQSTGVFDQLTVREVVGHFAGFYPHPLPVDEVVRLVGLEEKRDERCSKLSGGQKRRVDVALGIVGDPDLVFLDEPTTGFDPAARRQAWDLVRNLAALGKTVILTTHYLDEAENLANRVAIILKGKLTELGTPHELRMRGQGQAQVSFRLKGGLQGAPFPRVEGAVRTEGDTVTVVTGAPTGTVEALAAWARGQGSAELPELVVKRPSLEDVYLEMIGDAEAEVAS